MTEVHSFGPDWARAFYLKWLGTKPVCARCGRPLGGPGICQDCAKITSEVTEVTVVQAVAED